MYSLYNTTSELDSLILVKLTSFMEKISHSKFPDELTALAAATISLLALLAVAEVITPGKAIYPSGNSTA